MTQYDYVYLDFSLTTSQSVLISSCDSSFDTTMTIVDWDDWDFVLGNCQDCDYMGYCGVDGRETYYFDNLTVGEYGVVMMAGLTTGGGDWSVTVECEEDSSWAEGVAGLTT